MIRNPREEYGRELLKLAQKDKNVVALDADLCKSTMSVYVEQDVPGQYIEVGIAEQNMIATAAGLAASGKVPFCHSFAVFIAGRAFDQIRQVVCLPKLNVKVVGSSAGLSDFGDGSTHQTIEDMAIMRAIPNMTVIVPGDGLQCAKAVRAAYELDGPVYIRITRSDMEDVSAEQDSFEIGRIYPVKQGRDITVFACGIMVDLAVKAAELLEGEGISVSVVNVPTIKPIDREAVIAEAKKTGKVLTCEEHSVIGGLGETIAGALRREKIEIDFLGIEDEFGQSCNTMEPLMEYYGLTVGNIADKIKSMI